MPTFKSPPQAAAVDAAVEADEAAVEAGAVSFVLPPQAARNALSALAPMAPAPKRSTRRRERLWWLSDVSSLDGSVIGSPFCTSADWWESLTAAETLLGS